MALIYYGFGNYGNIFYMKLLFVADGRSPIAQNWIHYFIERGDQVTLVSTFPGQPMPGLHRFETLDVAFSAAKRIQPTGQPGLKSGLWGGRTLSLRTGIRQWFGPLTVNRAARRLRDILRQEQPDLVHAMRIPYEGFVAADAAGLAPLLVSVWGNDFTLHAPSTPLMNHYTRWTLKIADALHTDCHRDGRLATEYGFGAGLPHLVTPGNGGIRPAIFHPPARPVEQPVIINPRGFRAYVRNDTFFKAIPLVLQQQPGAKFLCASMLGDPQAADWLARLEIAHAVELLPPLPHDKMAEVFRTAMIAVSPSTHDGTPNSLLEAMASGCLPVAGDLESIREWITPGENGLLVDPGDEQALAEAILQGINQPALRARAAQLNAQQVAERADYARNMARAAAFYEQVITETGDLLAHNRGA